MAAGFELINDHGSLLISADVPALQYKAKYSVTVPAGSAPNRYVEFTVTNCTAPVLFARPQDAAGDSRWFLLSYAPKSGSMTVRAYLMGSGALGGSGTGSLALTVYHFDMPNESVGGNFGMKLYDASAKCTFNSNEKLCLVVGDIFDVPSDGDIYVDGGIVFEPGSRSFSAPAGVLAAASMPGNFWREYTNRAAGVNRSYQTVAKVQGQTVSIWPQANTLVSDGPPQAPYDTEDRYTGSPGGVIIDVAGY